MAAMSALASEGRSVSGHREMLSHALDVFRQKQQLLALGTRLDLRVLLLDRGAEALDAPLAQHDLDARLVDVVPAAEAVERAQDRGQA